MAKSLRKLVFIPGEPSVQGNHQAGPYTEQELGSTLESKKRVTILPLVLLYMFRILQTTSTLIVPESTRPRGSLQGENLPYRVRSL